MQMDKNQSSDDELKSEEDEKEKEFMNLHFEAKKQSQQKYVRYLHKPIEIMFIIFSVYKDGLVIIANQNNCKIKIAMDRVQILSDNTEKDVDWCTDKINQQIQRIHCIELGIEEKYNVYNSPYFIQKSQALKFHMTKFNGKIYCHSNKINTHKIKQKSSELFLGKKIFPILFKDSRQRQQQIHFHIRSFIRKLISHFYQNEYKNRNVIVELDREENKINCIGEVQRNLLACKNIMKNALYGAVAIILRYNDVSDLNIKTEKIKSYSNKISKFPIYVGKLSKSSITIISKDNILKNLLKKQKMKIYMDLQPKTDIGFYLIKNLNNFSIKKTEIEKICQEKGYDFSNLGRGPYNYFKKIFLQEQQNSSIEEVLEIVISSLEKLQQIRERFDVPDIKSKEKVIHHQIQVTQGEFYSTGDILDHQQLSDLLKRNVMKERLKMSKQKLIEYNIFEGQQRSPIYWFLGQNQQKIQCQGKDMKAGIEYFQGKVKILQEKNKQEKCYFIENKILIL